MNTKRLSYLFIAIALILVLAVAVLTVAYNTNYAYADSNSVIVDFNQYVKNEYINYLIPVDVGINTTDRVGSANNYYFVRFNYSSGDGYTAFYYNTSSNTNYFILQSNEAGFFEDILFIDSSAQFRIFTRSSSLSISNYNIYNLTQMYGSSASSMTVEDCKSIFTSPSYSYTSGTPVNIGYENGYDNGYDYGYNDGYNAGIYDYLSSNPVINFNQIILNDYINYTTVSLQDFVANGVDLIYDHYYYVTINNNTSYDGSIYIYNSDFTVEHYIDFVSGPNKFIYHNTDNVSDLEITIIRYDDNQIEYSGFNFIDLTKAFGDRVNDFTLDDYNTIFSSEFYPYLIDETISINGLSDYNSGYIKGFNDATGTFDWIATNSYFVNAIQSVDITNKLYGEVSVYQTNFVRVNTNNTTLDLACFMPFNFVVPYGSTIRFGGAFSHNNGNFTTPLKFAYITNNQIVEVASANIGSGNTPVSVSFTAPVDLSGIYMIVGSDESASYSYFIYNANFEILTDDPYAAVESSYQSGYDRAKDYFDNYYAPNGLGYNAIFNAGKVAGINENNPYTFSYLMSSVVEAPLNAVLSIFNFEFLGYNFKNFITVMLTLCLIIAIVRMFMGGKE